MEDLRQSYLARISGAAHEAALEEVRLAALGKKGEISLKMRELGQMAPEERQQVAPVLNQLRDEIDACVFGAYGTLFDVGSAIGRYRDVLGNKVAPLISAWRAKQVSYAWLRSLMGDYVDFWHVTVSSL